MSGPGTDPVRMLRALAGVRAPGGPTRGNQSEGDAFARILERARTGELRSGAPVRIVSGAGVTLTSEQLERLSAAADRAEAHGAGRAAFLIDGRCVVMDVGVRRVLGAMDLSGEGVLGEIDAVVAVPAPAADGEAVLAPPGLSGRGMNEALLRVLAG
ncbi:MAG TPA: hypothetical protein VD971_07810 [Phycisphaerales bacterium]|nr:hypothetical protein [Phycisphaerales bacterium]